MEVEVLALQLVKTSIEAAVEKHNSEGSSAAPVVADVSHQRITQLLHGPSKVVHDASVKKTKMLLFAVDASFLYFSYLIALH